MNSDSLSLWLHQRQAIDLCTRYLESDIAGACLVQHPTGSGKTGIMAVLAKINSLIKPVIIICPSDALVEQLRADIAESFWAKIGAPDEWRVENTPRLTRSTLDKVVECVKNNKCCNVVVFTTPQALSDIYSQGDYSIIKGLFGCAFFDEGHREPSIKWAKATRELGCKIILFSATPYRNDLKLFNIDKNYHHYFSFHEAVDKNVIRNIEFISAELSYDDKQFAKDVIAERKRRIRNGEVNDEEKIIIRTDSKEHVENLYKAFLVELACSNEGVLAIHSTFADETQKRSSMLSQVPRNLRERKETYLIHQYMLIEGIDDPFCSTLILHRTFSNERLLVQQIGRITRKNESIATPDYPAKVYVSDGNNTEKMWLRFQDYNRLCMEPEKNPLHRQANYIESLVNTLPDIDYQDRKFRKRVDFNSPTIKDEIRVPLSALVFKKTNNFNDKNFSLAIKNHLENDDRYIIATYQGCILSISIHQSSFLAESLFQTPTLEITLWRNEDKWLFFYDSAGLWVDDLPNVGRRIDARELTTLLPQGSTTKINMLTMKNTDLGPYALRGKTLQANSLEYAGTFVGEHMHVITRTRGHIGNKRRQISFISGRVFEGQGIQATLDEYSQWCADINNELKIGALSSTIFTRFANQIRNTLRTENGKKHPTGY